MLPSITVQGTVVEDPTLRFTAKGDALVNVRVVASSNKKQPDGTWAEGDKCFINVVAWRAMAENVAESLTKGTRVVVVGRLREREYETKDGEQRRVMEIDADTIAVDLRTQQARVSKAERSSAPATAQDDPWADAPPF